MSRAEATGAGRRRGLRQWGYRDGLAGRPAASLELDYQAGWRRGAERRHELTSSAAELEPRQAK